MTQRNVELQLQALDVIERRHLNSTASSSIDDGDVDAMAGTSSANVSIDKPIPERDQTEEDLDEVIQEEMKYVQSHSNTMTNVINFIWISRKSVAHENEEKVGVEDADPAKTDDTDEQVEKRMQRLNLYFEKENVSI